MRNRLFTTLFLLTFIGCSGYTEKKLISCFVINPNNLQFVRVSYYYINKIAYGGEDLLQYVIEIENTSDNVLDSLFLTINYRWSATLKNLLIYRGFFKGYQPFGSSAFPAKKKIQFVFNNDSSNRLIFADSSGKNLPELVLFRSLRLQTDKGAGSWGFPDP